MLSRQGTFVLSKIALLVLLSILVSFAFAGCSSGPPDKVLAKFSLALVDRDSDKAKRYCTDSFNSSYMTGIETMMGFMPAEYSIPGSEMPNASELAEMYEYTIDGDTARVWQPEMPWVKWVMVKKGASWKINDLDIDLAAMAQGMEDMGFDMSQMPQY